MPVGAIATKGALGEARTAGYRERRGMTDSGTRVPEDDDDVYYSKGRRPREDEEGEESYEKRRQWPGRGG